MLFLVFLIVGVAAQGSTTDPCDPKLYLGTGYDAWKSTWTPVPYGEWGYDNVTESATGVETPTPCGFKSAQVQEDNNPGFCLDVPSVSDMNVQVLLQSEEPGVRMCIQTKQPPNSPMATGALQPTCGEGQVRVCFPAESGYFSGGAPLNLYIYAEPATAAFNFYYKVDHSISRMNVPATSSAVDNVDMWCTMIEGTIHTLWPDDCKPLDFQTPPPTPPFGDNMNSAHRFSPLLAVFFTFFLMLN